MLIAITGATGFLGRYLVRRLLASGHQCRCWYRPESDRSEMPAEVHWVPGRLGDEATCRALAESLAAGQTSVGIRIEFDHLSASRVGSQVTAEAVLEQVNGKQLEFSVSARDPVGLVGTGRVTRVLVETAAFLARAR